MSRAFARSAFNFFRKIKGLSYNHRHAYTAKSGLIGCNQKVILQWLFFICRGEKHNTNRSRWIDTL